MRLRALAVVTAVLLMIASVAAQQNSPAARPERSQRPAAAHKAAGRPCSCAITDEQARAMQSDLQRMRTLVQQMQMNLVSLPPGPTPLRHQFELEIEMWQALLDSLGRNLQAPPPQALPER